MAQKTKDDWSRIERARNTHWYRKQAMLYAQRLGEYLDANPSRATKARLAIVEALRTLDQTFSHERDAREAIETAERCGWHAPTSAAKVIAKAVRPSESFKDFLRKTA